MSNMIKTLLVCNISDLVISTSASVVCVRKILEKFKNMFPVSGEPEKTGKLLLNIFDTMEYNESAMDPRFDSILKWTATFEDNLRSIIEEVFVEVEDTSRSDILHVFNKEIKVSYSEVKDLSCDSPAGYAQNLRESQKIENPQDVLERVGKELCAAESYASGTPLWQLLHYDLPIWQSIMTKIPSVLPPIWNKTDKAKRKICLLHLRRDGLPTVGKLLSLLHSILQTNEEITIIPGIFRKEDLPCLVPALRLIEEVNQATVRYEMCPIDFVVLDLTSEDGIKDLINTIGSVFVCGCELDGILDSPLSNISTSFHSGFFSSDSSGWNLSRNVHYIIDPTADLESSLLSIASDVWTSGAIVNSRDQAVLFVQESFYHKAIAIFEKILPKIKVVEHCGNLAVDFIRKKDKAIQFRAENEGFKTVPSSSDFTIPTVVYDIGTSSPLMNERRKRQGHILFLIPYRSNPELITLSNQFGNEKTVSLFTSDVSRFPGISKGLKGNGFWVNGPPQRTYETACQNLNWFQIRHPQPDLPESSDKKLSSEFKAIFQKAEGEWSKWLKGTTSHSRFTKLMRAAENITSSAHTRTLNELLRKTEEDDTEIGNLIAYHRRPCGVVGIIFTNMETNTDQYSVLVPILAAVGCGNAVLALSTMKNFPLKEYGFDKYMGENSPNLVQYMEVSSVKKGLQLLAQEGKVPVVWIIHGGSIGINVRDIPQNAFSRILVDDYRSILDLHQSRRNCLEFSTPVFL